MTLDPLQVYDWVAKVGLPGAMAVFIWLLYTRRLHWHQELVDTITRMETEYSRMKTYLENRVTDLLGERNEFKEMVISSQRVASKSMDVLSEQSKKDR